MKERISALMDGELERREAAGAIGALESGEEARELWRAYHMIGDAMRETHMLSAGFTERVVARLEKEPTVLAPQRPRVAPMTMGWSALAASVAAAAFVGWVAFFPQDFQPQKVAKAAPAPVPAQVQEAALVAPPDAANDYLLAHRGYSLRNTLQGAAPYVRVAGEAEARRR